MNLLNYLFSGWIANFGVVPLFSFAFFLFAPAFFLLSFLLIRVCVVLDDILNSLKIKLVILSERSFITSFAIAVKVFTLVLICPVDTKAAPQEYFLARGEQVEISTENLVNFSIGNKEVLKHRYIRSKNKLLIKARSIGFSDLVIWKKPNLKEIHHFYVSSKREHLNKMVLADILEDGGLKTKISGEMIYAEGEIKDIQTFMMIKKIQRSAPKNLSLNISLASNLRRLIVEKIYTDFYKAGADFIDCSEINTTITCQLASSLDHKVLIKFFEENYFIEFSPFKKRKKLSNFTLRFHIFSLENKSQNNETLPFSKVETKLSSILNNANPFEENLIQIGKTNMRVNLVATPTLNIVFDKKFSIELGGDISFQSQRQQQIVTNWRFAGLKIKGLLTLKNNHFFLEYQSYLTRPVNNQISGPRGRSSIYLNPGKTEKLYSIDVDLKQEMKHNLPYLSNIPALGNIFQSSQQERGKKRILVLIRLEEI